MNCFFRLGIDEGVIEGSGIACGPPRSSNGENTTAAPEGRGGRNSKSAQYESVLTSSAHLVLTAWLQLLQVG